jgi:hypothetical protein
MPQFMAIPKTSHAVTEVATSAALKTVLQVATPSTTVIKVLAWGISFDGTTVTDAAGQCTLIDVNVAATVTTLTPEIWGNVGTNASLCVGGTALTGYNASAEGSITGSKIIDAQNVHPQTGYSIWFPGGPIVLQSRFLRIRTNFAVGVNCIPWILWEEQP